jgi:nucleoside-diphosphate-sugar epimerase
MKAIVTGGAGFIGSHIADKLLKLGAKVTIIDNLSSGKAENIPTGAKFVEADVAYVFEWWAREFEKTDVVFHNAASKKNICLKDPGRDLRVNGGGTLNLLQIAKKYDVKKFVHASTGSVYGDVIGSIDEDTCKNPVSYYGVSKLAGENYVRYFNNTYALNTTILRYFHVYGERQEDDPDTGGVVAIFKKQIAEGKPITIHGSGEQERLFTHVEDIVEANIKVMETPGNDIYNCAASKTVTINQLAKKLGADKIKHVAPLVGDIFSFDISTEKIQKLGVRFRDFG